MPASTYPPDWVTLSTPLPASVLAVGDGCHYTTDDLGRVAVRPYHVHELIGRGCTVANAELADAVAQSIVDRSEHRLTPEQAALVIGQAALAQNGPKPRPKSSPAPGADAPTVAEASPTPVP